jgi:Cu2+-exporting ATPase
VDIMLLGHWIEMATVQGASRALEHLALILPAVAHRMRGEQIEEILVSELQTGDLVLVRPGEQVPADGIVREGASSVNEAFLTGESRPVPKEPGSELIAGAVNGEGVLKLEVSRTGEQTALHQIMRLVKEAQSSRSRFQMLADKAALRLTFIAIGAAALTFLIWTLLKADLTFRIERTVTLLVIACPHALGLAIPLVIVNATALAAQNGILVRNREAFERARNLQVVAFDKTGTLTEGQFGLRAVYTASMDENHALQLAANLEALSEHPLAEAIVQEAKQRSLTITPANAIQAVPGKGIEARQGARLYRAGRPEWAQELKAELPAQLQAGLREADERGESTILLMEETAPVALFALADRVRESAKRAVQVLQKRGIQVVMITGDAQAVAQNVAAELGIKRYYARVLPQQKAMLLREIKEEGHSIAFVGDGINDAPALVEADIGIAIGAGTNVAIEAADLVLVENDPLDVARIFILSRATYNKMVQNLLWATGYNALAMPLAAGVAYKAGLLLSPAVGAIFMSISTVIVAINAMLLRRTDLEGGT